MIQNRFLAEIQGYGIDIFAIVIHYKE